MIKIGDNNEAQVPAATVRSDDDDDDEGDDHAQVPAILRAVVFACVGVAIVCTVAKSIIQITWLEDLRLEGNKSKQVIAHIFLILCSLCVLWIAAVSFTEAFLSRRRQPSVPDVEKAEVEAVDRRPLLHDFPIGNR